MRTLPALACFIVALVFPALAWPQALTCVDSGANPALARDEGACLQRVAEGVYSIVHADATDEWPHSNTVVIEGRNSLFVIDSTYLPSRARADIALIRQVTPKPVRYLATTHWHMDHNFGASAYLDAYPNLTYLVEEETARMMTLNQRWFARFSTSEAGARRAALANLEAELARGLDGDGRAFTTEERARRLRVIEGRQAEQAELRTLRVVQPTELINGSRSFNFEGRRIEIAVWGRGNSPVDTTYYLPRERVLVTGDLIVQSPLPYTGSSYPRDWAVLLREIESIPIRVLVPGHGPVMHDHAYTHQVRTLIEAVNERVEEALANGQSLDQAKAQILLPELRVGVWASSEAPAEDWAIIVRVLVERAWQNIRGQES